MCQHCADFIPFKHHSSPVRSYQFCSHFTEAQRSYMPYLRPHSREAITRIQAICLNFRLPATHTKMCRFPHCHRNSMSPFQEGRRGNRVPVWGKSNSSKGKRQAMTTRQPWQWAGPWFPYNNSVTGLLAEYQSSLENCSKPTRCHTPLCWGNSLKCKPDAL